MKYQTLSFLLLLSLFAHSQNYKGEWKGEIQNTDTKVAIDLIVINQRDSFVGAFLMQPKVELLTDSSANQSTLFLQSTQSNIYFKGELARNKNQLSGELFLNDKLYTIDLFRGDKAIYRPQEPKKPYPYISEDICFTNQQDSVQLAGTLTMPNKTGKFPAVILQSGSLPSNRDYEVNHHKFFLVIADYLTRNGIAVLRFDDRGVGGSGGSFWQSTAEDRAEDVHAGYRFLASRQEIDSLQIGIIGHSEGGMVATIAASKFDDFKFILTMGAPGIPLREVFDMQVETKFARGETICEDLQFVRKLNKTVNRLAEKNTDPIVMVDSLKRFEKEFTEVMSLFKETIDNFQTQISFYSIIKMKSSIHNQFNIQVVPAEYIENITCSVLSLNGSNDIFVPAKINQDAIRNALIKGGNNDFEIIELQGLNHSLRECFTGSVEEALELEQTISPNALELIKDWILERVEIKY